MLRRDRRDNRSTRPRIVLVAVMLAVVTGAAACAPRLSTPSSGGPRSGSWADHLGVITSTDPADLTIAAGLGVGWIRLEWKQGWGPDDDWAPKRVYVDRAHELGLEVMVTCTRSDRTYSPATINQFAHWCAGWVDVGVDAIEIGNEWNWEWFIGGPEKVQSAADVTEVVSKTIRERSTAVKIITNGWAPVYAPSAIDPASATNTMLRRQPLIKYRAHAVAWHPYVNTGEPRYVVTGQDPGTSAFLKGQVRTIARVAPRQEQWFTEIGVPSTPRGSTAFTESVQAVQIQRYFNAITAWSREGIKIGVAFIYSLKDSAFAKSYGLYRTNFWGQLVEKPAARVVERQARRDW